MISLPRQAPKPRQRRADRFPLGSLLRLHLAVRATWGYLSCLTAAAPGSVSRTARFPSASPMSVTRLIRRFNTRFPRDRATLRLRQPCGEDRCQISRVRVSDGHQRNPKTRCEFHLMVSFHHVSRIVRKAQRLDVGSVWELHITGIRRDTRQLPCKCRAESLEPTHTGSRTARATCSPSLSSAERRALRRLGRGALYRVRVSCRRPSRCRDSRPSSSAVSRRSAISWAAARCTFSSAIACAKADVS